MRSTPLNGIGRDSNPGISLRKSERCPLDGMTSVPARPVDVPSSPVRLKLTDESPGPVLSMATPVMVPLLLSASVYIRNALPKLIEGVLAWDTVIPAFWKEKTATPTGAALKGLGMTCAVPTVVCEELFGVANC